MKTLGKAIAAASLAAVSINAVAVEGLSTTIGAATDYVFRGEKLGDASAYGSLDYEVAGFYAGVWAIDAGETADDGLEVDLYLGYGVDLDGIDLGIGYTRYEYTTEDTPDFEHEINLSAAVAGFGLDIALGEADDDEDEADYTVIQLSYGSGPWGVMLGSYDRDDEGAITEKEYKWAELSYAAEIGTFDVTATAGRRFDEEVNNVENTSAGRDYITLDLSKSFDL